MKRRLSDKQIESLVPVEDGLTKDLLLDLRDARARARELEEWLLLLHRRQQKIALYDHEIKGFNALAKQIRQERNHG